jgi:arginine N-succinyltransferase
MASGPPFVIRPAQGGDLEPLEALISQVRVGITSLAIDRETLERRIEQSVSSFSTDVGEPGDERYFFVLEELGSNEIAGMSAVRAAVGLHEAFYSYRVGTEVHASRELEIHRQLPALYLSNDYTGCTELTSLFLSPRHRGKGLGTLLSKSRLLFISEFSQRFADKVIAEIRGISDTRGRSPFWDGLGQHFFAMDFPTADHLVGAGNKSFIAELMPKHPIYVLFLPRDAQEAIGKSHENSRHALRLLEDEGFRYENYIDIFDAGPTVECRREDIRAVRTSQRLHLRLGPVDANAMRCLVSNTRARDFRCCLSTLVLDGSGTAIIDRETAGALRISDGEPVRVLELS